MLQRACRSDVLRVRCLVLMDAPAGLFRSNCIHRIVLGRGAFSLGGLRPVQMNVMIYGGVDGRDGTAIC